MLRGAARGFEVENERVEIGVLSWDGEQLGDGVAVMERREWEVVIERREKEERRECVEVAVEVDIWRGEEGRRWVKL